MCTWQWLSHHPLSCSGSRSGAIHHHDVRVPDHHVGSLIEHTQEVCGLTWSPDGRHLASGGNDNVVNVWDTTLALEGVSPVQTFTHHLAAVKVHVFSSIYFLLACTFWFLSSKVVNIFRRKHSSRNRFIVNQLLSVFKEIYQLKFTCHKKWSLQTSLSLIKIQQIKMFTVYVCSKQIEMGVILK